MNLNILSPEESEPGLLADCIAKALAFYGDNATCAVEAVIYCRKRQPDGWAEYGIRLPYIYNPEKSLLIGAIQRQPGAQTEFHS